MIAISQMASTLALALALAGGALALGLPLARQWQDSTDRKLEQRPEAAIGRREEGTMFGSYLPLLVCQASSAKTSTTGSLESTLSSH